MHFIKFCVTFISVYAFTRISIRVYVEYNWKNDIIFHFIKEADNLLNYDSTGGLNTALLLYILCAQPSFGPNTSWELLEPFLTVWQLHIGTSI